MQITTNTPKRLKRALSIALSVMALASVAACDQAATFIAQAGGDARVESGAAFQARVVGVTDGDTLTVLDAQNQQHRVRLAEIDAPERGQPWGDRSRQALSALVFGKTISVQQTDTDRYGRVVARVFADGQDVNRTMVEQGAAWAYRQHLTDETLIATEARARRARAGLWAMSDAQTVAPWEWRQGVRDGQRDTGSPTAVARPQALFANGPRSAATGSTDQLSCSGKRYCREVSSCEEANFYLRQCGVSSLDGDGDGRPCEVLCRGEGR